MLKKYVPNFIQGVVLLLLAVFALFFPSSIDKMPFWLRLIISIFCAAVYIITWFVKQEKSNKILLQEESQKYYDFFINWYSQHGKLSIFCSDLDWMISPPYDIVNTICEKGKDCTIYLKGEDIQPEIKRRLNEKNVVLSLNHNLITSNRFSLLEDANAACLIISDKKVGKDKGTIEVRQEDNSSNPYIINVVKDLLTSMDRNIK
jgi:Ca2+/Na+ antiporter